MRPAIVSPAKSEASLSTWTQRRACGNAVPVQLNPLLRELLAAVIRLPPLYDEDGADGRLARVLLDRIAVLPDEPLHLPMPVSRKLRAIAVDYSEHPTKSGSSKHLERSEQIISTERPGPEKPEAQAKDPANGASG